MNDQLRKDHLIEGYTYERLPHRRRNQTRFDDDKQDQHHDRQSNRARGPSTLLENRHHWISGRCRKRRLQISDAEDIRDQYDKGRWDVDYEGPPYRSRNYYAGFTGFFCHMSGGVRSDDGEHSADLANADGEA